MMTIGSGLTGLIRCSVRCLSYGSIKSIPTRQTSSVKEAFLTASSNCESVRTAVEAGYGLTFISRSAIEAGLAAGTLGEARVEGLDPGRDIFLARSPGRSLTRAAQAFLDLAGERLTSP